MSPDRPLRVLHCPTATAGIPQALAQAERSVGADSTAIAYTGTGFAHGVDRVLWSPWMPRPLREVRRIELLWKAATWADVIHFNYGETILPRSMVPAGQTASSESKETFARRLWARYVRAVEHKDLALLRRRGRPIFVTFLGDDARQGDRSRELFEITFANEVEPDYYVPAVDQLKRERIQVLDQVAARIYAVNPDLLHVLPERAEFLPYASVDPRQVEPVPGRAERTGPPLVVHAPSHRGVKGTRYVLEAVEALRREGIEFQFRLVEDVTHQEALALFGKADVVIDQLLCGWYGVSAVEAMALGTPVVGYIREGDLKFVPDGMREDLPLIRASPKDITDVLRRWICASAGERNSQGEQGPAFVERYHDPAEIARRLIRDYHDALAR